MHMENFFASFTSAPTFGSAAHSRLSLRFCFANVFLTLHEQWLMSFFGVSGGWMDVWRYYVIGVMAPG